MFTAELATVAHSLPAAFVAPPGRSLIEAFLKGRNARTLAAYGADLGDFAAFVGAPSIDAAASALLSRTHGEANGLALAYRAHLIERGLAPATVNRRLAALRSLGKLARLLGMVPWCLEVESVKGETYRDTRGPGRAGVRALLASLAARLDAKGRRDTAIVRCLFDLAFRRGEVVSLDLEHLNLAEGCVHVLGKGRTGRARITLPAPTKAALAAWLEVRGNGPGPLFTSLDRASKGHRLTGAAVYAMIRELGEGAGYRARPHGLRHAAITEALEATNGNMRTVAKFSRHRDVRVLGVYDDNRADLAGDVAAMVSGAA